MVSFMRWVGTLLLKNRTKPKTGTTAHSTKKYKALEKKKEKMRKLYRKYRDKDYSEKDCYNIISSKHFPDFSPSTVETYINKK